jgi:hypothetical protein
LSQQFLLKISFSNLVNLTLIPDSRLISSPHIECSNQQFKSSSFEISVNKEQNHFNQFPQNLEQNHPDFSALNQNTPNDRESQNIQSPPINEKSNSPSFAIKFLQTLAIQFPTILRKYFVEYLHSASCQTSVKLAISIREVSRAKQTQLLAFINKFSPIFSSMTNENVIVKLIHQVYQECILQVPHQKKKRILQFITLYSDASLYFRTNVSLASLQNEIKNFN